MEKKTQKIVPIVMEGEELYCLAYSISEGCVALGMKTNDESCIVLVDMHTCKRKKIFKTGGKDVFLGVAFSTDGKVVMAQGGGSEWMLYVWTIDKCKLVSSSKSTSGALALRKMSCNAHDQTTQICVTGENLIRVFRFQEGFLKLIHQVKMDHDARAHCWVSETRVVVGTADAKMLVFESGEIIGQVEYLAPISSSSDVEIKQPGISAIASFPSGILVGLDNGVLLYYENGDEAVLYKKKKEFVVDSGAINVIHWNVKEDKAVLSLSNSQLYLLQIENNAQGEVVKLERLGYAFHDGAVVGMDTCICKPWLVTSGMDRTIRIWNYLEHSVEVACGYSEVASSVAFHPSGMYILACFTSSIKLMAVLLDEIHPYWEYGIRSAKEGKFANGGHYFAVVSSINVIIFDTWSQEPIASLKVASARIKYIEWSKDDAFIFAFCADGSYQQWDVVTWRKVNEIAMPGLLASATVNHNAQTVYIYTKEGLIKEIHLGRVTREWTSKHPLSAISISSSGQMMFATKAQGGVVAYKFPFSQEGVGPDEFNEYHPLGVPSTQMKTTTNERHLFTGGVDGSVWIFRIQDKEGRIAKQEKDWIYSEEILVTKSELKESYKVMNDLKTKVAEIKNASDTELRNKDAAHTARLNEITEKYTEEINSLKEKSDILEKELQELMSQNKAMMVATRKANGIEIKEVNDSFLEKLESEKNRYAALVDRRNQLEAQWEYRMNEIQLDNNQKSEDIKRHYKKMIEDVVLNIAKTKKEAGTLVAKHEEQVREVEEDVEKEYLEITFQFENKLKEEKTMLEKVKEENKSMIVTFRALQSEVEDHKRQLIDHDRETKRLFECTRKLDGDIMGLHNELKERDDTIIEKEKRIYDLKKKNQELEKFKFVLEYKIVELKKQIEPRERDIELMSTQIEEMAVELKGYGIKKFELDKAVEDLQLKNHATLVRHHTEKWRNQQLETLVQSFQQELNTVYKSIHDKEMLKKECTRVYHAFKDVNERPPEWAPKETLADSTGENNTNARIKPYVNQSEVAKERKQLESSLQILKNDDLKLKKKFKSEAKKMMSEGMVLNQYVPLM